jgi:hypothetical protein
MGDLLLEPIRQTAQARSLSPSARSVRITAAVLGQRSSIMGAIVQGVSKALYELTEVVLNQVCDSEKPVVGELVNSLENR